MSKPYNISKIFLQLLFSLICFILINVKGSAQNFMMSSVGNLTGTSNNASAVNFKSIANCIDVQSGIAVFNAIRNTGEFSVNCNILQEFNSLGVKMFPNPARKSSMVKFIKSPPLNDNFSVSVLTSGGALMSARRETGYTLTQGIILDVTNLTSGTYILKIESSQFLEAIKFIKAN